MIVKDVDVCEAYSSKQHHHTLKETPEENENNSNWKTNGI